VGEGIEGHVILLWELVIFVDRLGICKKIALRILVQRAIKKWYVINVARKVTGLMFVTSLSSREVRDLGVRAKSQGKDHQHLKFKG